MSNNNISARIDSARNALLRDGVESAYIRNLSDIAWLTGFDKVFDSEPAHAIAIDAQNCYFHTDSRYIQAVREANTENLWQVDALAVAHTTWFGQQVKATTVACEDTLTVAECNNFKASCEIYDNFGQIHLTHDVVRSLRAVKDKEEIAALRFAQSITDKAFEHIISYIRPGMTEKQVAFELECTMRKLGADDLAFPSIVATGVNAAKPHSTPSDDVLVDGDLVVLDFGAKAHGYCSDMTRTIGIGALSQKAQDVYDVVRMANEHVEAFLQEGVIAKETHLLAESILDKHGFGGLMGHSLGHGVGIDIHELPNLSPKNDQPLVSGNVVTVEPGIYITNELGCRLEDFGVISHDGFEVFTQSPHELIIIS